MRGSMSKLPGSASPTAPMAQRSTARRSALAPLLLCAAALLACLSVALVNGGPLFYFDTEGYLDKGGEMLARLLPAPPDPAAAAGASGAAGPGMKGDGGVDGTRSVLYSLVLAGLARIPALEVTVLLNAAVVLLMAWLVARVLRRALGLDAPVTLLATVPVLAAATTALPFYVAYLMPDIFTPLLLLSAALLTGFAWKMTWWELLLTLLVGWTAGISHLSHLGIAPLLVPPALVGAILVWGRRWWLPTLLVASLAVIPVVEKKLFAASVKAVAGPRTEVVYKPFMTARLIQDGPGLTYLEKTCPDAAEPTCALWDALQLSQDPYRLTASHIMFEQGERLGSFRRMTADNMRSVTQAQWAFFFRVAMDQPVATTMAFLGNVLRQSAMVSVAMTLQDDPIVERLAPAEGLAFGPFGHGRLTADTGWLPAVTALHHAIYLASLAVILGFLAWPRALPLPLRVMAAMVLAGILVNALVCGGISQPAERYGARVAWLLPMTGALMALAWRFRPGAGAGAPAGPPAGRR